MNDSERIVLGALLCGYGDAIHEIELDPADHHEPRHETIHRAILDLHQAQRAIDTVTVADKLGSELERVGGLAYLAECVAACPAPANGVYHAEIVAREAIRRRLIQAGTWIADQAREHDPEDVHDRARSMLDRLPGVTTQVTPLSDTLMATIEALDAKADAAFVRTPWQELDRAIGGWRPGCLYVVGARPGVGKSVLGVQAALGVARAGRSVAFASLEMSGEEVGTRLLAQVGRVDMGRLANRALRSQDWESVSRAQGQMADLPIFISDAPVQRVSDVRSFARSVSRKAPLGLVVVDYLQLLTPASTTARGASRAEVVADISRSLKILAKELQVPVIAAAQVNRASEQGGSKPPTLANLRESGGIESDADVVLLLHRVMDGDPDAASTLHLLVAKNRHGVTGPLRLIWQGHYARAITSETHLQEAS